MMLETGIKVIDLLEPYVQGGKIGMFGGAGVGKTVIIQEMIRRQARAARRRVGLRRRGRAHPRGQRPVPRDDRVRRDREDRARVRPDGRAAGRAAARRAVGAHDGRVLPRRGAQGRAAVRRQHLPVHAGRLRGLDAARAHAVARSATSRRSPSEMGELQERITSTKGRSITSLQAIYVPADDITDPAPHTAFAHLDATTVLSRDIASLGIYPAVDPLDSTSPDPRRRATWARSTTRSRGACRRSCSATRTCRTSSRSSASTSCPRRTRSSSSRARKIQRFLSQPFFVAEQFTGIPGKYVPIDETIASFKGLVRGRVRPPARAGVPAGRRDRGGRRAGEADGGGAPRCRSRSTSSRPSARSGPARPRW